MTEQTVILAGTQADAAAIAERLGLTYEQWVTPTTIGEIRGRSEAPVYFDYATFEQNPAREQLRDWFAWKITPPELRPAPPIVKETMPTAETAPKSRIAPPVHRPWFVGVARKVGLDYLNQTDGNVIAIDKDGDQWTPDAETGVWRCTDLDDQIAPEFGPFDVYAA